DIRVRGRARALRDLGCDTLDVGRSIHQDASKSCLRHTTCSSGADPDGSTSHHRHFQIVHAKTPPSMVQLAPPHEQRPVGYSSATVRKRDWTLRSCSPHNFLGCPSKRSRESDIEPIGVRPTVTHPPSTEPYVRECRIRLLPWVVTSRRGFG